MNNICIYHKNCADGFAAALAVKVHFDTKGEECEFIPAQYGEEPPAVTDKNVIIVDFSYPREVLLSMFEQAESLIVLDHHKTAEKALEGLDFCIFDMNKSGAMMAWECFHGSLSTPLLFHYVQDRDLWQWQLPDSKAVSAALQTLSLDFDVWERYLDDAAISGLVAKGTAILEYQEVLINRAVNPKNLKFVTVAGERVPMINATVLISEICGKLAEEYPFAISYFDTPEKRVFSLRSRGNGADVSEIAKQFGGGGHAQAAGFTLGFDELGKIEPRELPKGIYLQTASYYSVKGPIYKVLPILCSRGAN